MGTGTPARTGALADGRMRTGLAMFGGDIPPADRAAVAAAASTLAHAISPLLTRLLFIAIRNMEGRGDRSRRIQFVPNAKFSLRRVDGSRSVAAATITTSATRYIRDSI